MHSRKPAVFYLLLAAGLLLTIVVLMGFYNALVVMPTWFADPPHSFGRIQAGNDPTARFLMIAQMIVFISLLTSIGMSWRVTTRRNALLLALVLYIAVAIVSGVYFVPELMRFTQTPLNAPASPELAARGQRWLLLNWGRAIGLLGTTTLIVYSLLTLKSSARASQ